MQPIPSSINKEIPLILLGLNGPAYSGKNDLARMLVPPAASSRILYNDEEQTDGFFLEWSNISFTLPLKAMYRNLMSMTGTQARDRKLYSTHSEIDALFGHSPISGAPPYDDLVSLVYEIVDYRLPESARARRDFMQWVGNRCRELMPECFINTVRTQILREHKRLVSEEMMYYDETQSSPAAHVVVIPDCRLQLEGQFLHDSPHSFVVSLDLNEDDAKKRALSLDDTRLTDEQLQDITETESRDWPQEWIDYSQNVADLDSMKPLAYDIVEKVNDYAKGLTHA